MYVLDQNYYKEKKKQLETFRFYKKDYNKQLMCLWRMGQIQCVCYFCYLFILLHQFLSFIQHIQTLGQLMDPVHTNLVKNTETLLNKGETDSEKFQSLYSEIRNFQINQQESLASKVGPLSQCQLYLLRSQILAYKHLVRNIPVPTNLNWSGAHSSIWQSEKQKLTTKAVTFYRQKIEKSQQLKNMITGNLKIPNKDDPSQTSQQIKFLIDKRKDQVQRMLQRSEQLSLQTRQKLQIEAKFLNVRDVYQKVLSKVVEGMKKDNKGVRLFQSQLLDRSFFRRQKVQKNRQTGNRVQKLQNQMKSDHERRKKIKHKQFMQHLRAHKEEFMEWHRKKQKDRKKIANQAKAIIDTKRKSKQDLQDKATLARLKALKQQDMTEYFKLVKQAKNNKIKELLGQTNKFLKELGAKVLIQKGNNQDDQQNQDGNQNNEQDMFTTFNASNNVYYNLTHTVKQEIQKQPSILQGGILKNYQLVGLQWLVSLYNNNLNGILADQMGLGKTIQAISLISYLIEFKKNYGPFLIVVPLSTMSNWVNQFEKWAPSIRKIIYRGNPATRNQILRIMKATKWNVCLTTYDFILKDRLRLNKYDWKYIIIDEGHKMKNAKSKFAGVLGQQYQSDHRLLLTGTPLQNNLGELWALLNFLLPKVFNSCDDFQKWFSMAISKNTGGQSVQLNEQEQLLIINRLHQVLRPFLLRRVKKQVQTQLPDKKQHVIKIQLSAWQKLIYDNISQKSAIQFSSGSEKMSTNTLTNLMMQLRKCCNHPYLFLRNYDDICYHDWIFRCSGKFQVLDRLLPKFKEFGHRVLIFTQMTHLMDIMQIYFDYKGIKHLRLDGSTKAEDRGDRMALFNKPGSQYDIFMLSTRAGGLGLNLQTADTVIIFDSDWNPQMDLQAQDRAHRIGQKKQVLVLRFITNTPIQQAILQKAAFKMGLDQLFIQGGLYNLSSSQAQRRKKIEDVLKRTNKDDQQDVQIEQIPDDATINDLIARNQDQYERFSKMDEQRYERERKMYKNFPEQLDNNADGSKEFFNYRLMNYDQIPGWFVQKPKQEQSKKQYGRGNRHRKQVNYCDDLTDEQFLKMCQQDQEQFEADDGGSSNLVIVPRKGRGRKPMSKNNDQPSHHLPGEYGEKIDKSKDNQEEYFEED